jgi:hypothetical protein
VGGTFENVGNIGNVTDEPLANDTAAIAKLRPTITDEEPKDTDTFARIVPWKLLEYPIVALDPIAQ